MADEGLEAQRDLLLHEMEQMEQQSLLHGKPTATPLPRGGGSVVHLARWGPIAFDMSTLGCWSDVG
jgi:hypothetical protein